MPSCTFVYDTLTGRDVCGECGVPLSKKSRYYTIPGKRYPVRNCPASITPEARAAREAQWKVQHDPHGKLDRCKECVHYVVDGCGLAVNAGVPCKRMEWLIAELALPGECQRFKTKG